jgi:hypothetical protein
MPFRNAFSVLTFSIIYFCYYLTQLILLFIAFGFGMFSKALAICLPLKPLSQYLALTLSFWWTWEFFYKTPHFLLLAILDLLELHYSVDFFPLPTFGTDYHQ